MCYLIVQHVPRANFALLASCCCCCRRCFCCVHNYFWFLLFSCFVVCKCVSSWRCCSCCCCIIVGVLLLTTFGITGLSYSLCCIEINDQPRTTNSTSHSTQQEVGWGNLVLVGPPSDVQSDSNFSLNVSSPDVSATLYTTPCSATIVHNLIWKNFEPLRPIVGPYTSPLNYNGSDIPLYALSGLLHYQCAVGSSNGLSTYNGNCTTEMALFDNETDYLQSKNGDMANAVARECLESGTPDSPAINNIRFELTASSLYYVTIKVEAGSVVNCSAYGNLSLYNPAEVVQSNCALGSRSWCSFSGTSLQKEAAGDNLMCVLAQSNELNVSTLQSTTTVTTNSNDVAGRTNWLYISLLVSSIVCLACGCLFCAIIGLVVCVKLSSSRSRRPTPM